MAARHRNGGGVGTRPPALTSDSDTCFFWAAFFFFRDSCSCCLAMAAVALPLAFAIVMGLFTEGRAPRGEAWVQAYSKQCAKEGDACTKRAVPPPNRPG